MSVMRAKNINISYRTFNPEITDAYDSYIIHTYMHLLGPQQLSNRFDFAVSVEPHIN